MKIGSSVYYCKAIYEDNILIGYEEPVEIITRPRFFTIMPTSGYSEIVVYGRDIVRKYTAIALLSAWGDTFKEGDKLYIDGAKPSAEEDEPGERANAEIKDVRYDNYYIKMIVDKLVA